MSHPSGFPPAGQGQPPYGQGQPGYGQGYPPGAYDQPQAAPTTTRRRSPVVPWIITGVAVLLAAGAVVWGLRSTTPETGNGLSAVVQEQNFATPEDAIRHVADRLAAGDVDSAYQAFAISSAAEKWDQVALLDRMRASGPQDPPNPRDPFFASSFTLWRLGQIGGQVRYLALSVTLPEDMADILSYRMMPLNDDLTAQQVVDGMMVGDLAGLTVDRVEPIALSESERYQETTAELRKAYGADEIKEFGVLYDYDGQTWLGGATVVRYGEKWLLWSLQSPLINQEVSGALTPATVQDFEDAVAAD